MATKIHKITVVDAITNEIVEREMTTDEKNDYLNFLSDIEKSNAQRQAEAEAKATQRQALLARLGITEEEARILLGGN